MKTYLLAATALLAFTACSTPWFAPSELSHVRVQTFDSSIVSIEPSWFYSDGTVYYLTGYVRRKIGADDTLHTHVDVIFLDHDGEVIEEVTVGFSPSALSGSHAHRRGSGLRRHHDHGDYQVAVASPYSQISTIQIRAHDLEPGSR